MTAAQTAATRIRAGMPPGLAIYKTCGEYGISTLHLAAELRARRKQKPALKRIRAWWDR